MSTFRRAVRRAQKSALCGCGGGVDGGMRVGAQGASRAGFAAVAICKKQLGARQMRCVGVNVWGGGVIGTASTRTLCQSQCIQIRSHGCLQPITHLQGRGRI